MAVLKDVAVLFSNVSAVDNYSGKYQLVVKLTEEQAADAESAGLTLKTKEYDGQTQYQAGFRTKFKPRILGKDGKTDLDLNAGEIGRNSLVSIQYSFRDWTGPGGNTSGTSQDLQMVQVKDMKAPNASQFEDESLGDDSGTEFDNTDV